MNFKPMAGWMRRWADRVDPPVDLFVSESPVAPTGHIEYLRLSDSNTDIVGASTNVNDIDFASDVVVSNLLDHRPPRLELVPDEDDVEPPILLCRCGHDIVDHKHGTMDGNDHLWCMVKIPSNSDGFCPCMDFVPSEEGSE